MNHETFLSLEPVFTGSELAAYLRRRGVADPCSAAIELGEQWRKAGRVVAVRPDVFAVVGEGRDPARFQPWPYLVAVKLAPDAVSSHRTAVDFWGYSHTMWYQYVYSATRPVPETGYGVVRYTGTRHPGSLVERGIPHFGVVEKDYAGGTVRVTTMERTLVDVMPIPRLGGTWDEIWRTLARADPYDLGAVSAYCDVLGAEAELRAKIGFFFDHNRHLWDIDDSSLDPPRRREGPRHHLDPGTLRPCRFVEEWNRARSETCSQREVSCRGKWDLRYRTAWGHRDSIAVDVNYVRPVPLWSPTHRDSIRLGRWQATGVTVADVHELAAGKLNGFYKRALPRDLFDVGLIPGLPGLDPSKLRTAFVVYGAGARPDWWDVCAATPTVAPGDPAARLRATLPRAEAGRTRPIRSTPTWPNWPIRPSRPSRWWSPSTQPSERSWMG